MLDIVATESGTRVLARGMMLEARAITQHFRTSFHVDRGRRITGTANLGVLHTSMPEDVFPDRPI